MGRIKGSGKNANLKCSIDSCIRSYYAKGLCHSHYNMTTPKYKATHKIRNYDHVCEAPGCNKVTPSAQYCPIHTYRLKNTGQFDPTDIKGERNPRWNGGTSEYTNHCLFKKQRLIKLNQVGFFCERCNIEKATNVHHVDKNKSNHDISNLMALCAKCHCSFHKEERGRPKKFNLTLQEIANNIGVSMATLSKYSNNKNSITRLSVIKRIEDYFLKNPLHFIK